MNDQQNKERPLIIQNSVFLGSSTRSRSSTSFIEGTATTYAVEWNAGINGNAAEMVGERKWIVDPERKVECINGIRIN